MNLKGRVTRALEVMTAKTIVQSQEIRYQIRA